MFDTELNSGFIEETDINIANHFTEIQLIHPSRNGYSEVYKAKRFGKWHTLKRITDSEKGNVRYQNLLEKEFEIAIQLSHPNIVQTIGLEEITELESCIVLIIVRPATVTTAFYLNAVPSAAYPK